MTITLDILLDIALDLIKIYIKGSRERVSSTCLDLISAMVGEARMKNQIRY